MLTYGTSAFSHSPAYSARPQIWDYHGMPVYSGQPG